LTSKKYQKPKTISTISFKNKKIFFPNIGIRVLVKDLYKNKKVKTFGFISLKPNSVSKIPLFSTNPFEIYGYVEKSNLKDFKNPYVLWGIDGDFNIEIMPAGKKFATTDHCGCVEILDSKILPEFIVWRMEMKKYELGFVRSFRPSLERMSKQVQFKIPLDSKGNFDLTEQKRIVKAYKPYKDFHSRILEIKDEVENQNVSLESDYEGKKVLISKLFTVRRGNVFYTKKRILGKKWYGDIPVYSSKTEDNGLLTKIKLKQIKNEDLYYKHCLTWATDGYAGTLTIRNEDNVNNEKKKKFYFTATDHCGILTPNYSTIYLPFIRYELEPIFLQKTKGYGKNELKKKAVEAITIKIPTDSNGDYDFDKQREIAKSYENVEKAKKLVSEQMDKVVSKFVILN